MNIQELGSLGEFIAAIATIATLIYLALQIRQNTRALKHAEFRAIQDDADRWRTHVIADKDVASLYRIGLTGSDSLDEDDRLRFRMLQDQLFYGWQYILLTRGEIAHAQQEFIARTLSQPGGRHYWEKHSHMFDPQFVSFVEGLQRQNRASTT